MKDVKNDNTELSDREYVRLKELIEAGKTYHYRNFFFTVLVFVLLVKNELESLKLVLDVELPVKFLMLVLYLLTVVYTIITLDIIIEIWKTISTKFINEIPFNWFVLTGKKTKIVTGFWVILPFILCSIGIAFSKLSVDKGALIFIGILSIALPNYLKEFAFKVSDKVDENGRPISFSIYLLYWYRLLRTILVLIIPSLSIYSYLSASSSFGELLVKYFPLILIIIVIFILRILGVFIYKYIDKVGTKLGFVNEYKIEK